MNSIPLLFISYQQITSDDGAWANRKRREPHPVFWSGKWHCAIGEKQGVVVFSGLLFFGSFLLEEQKK
jgi:hypothetical protein